MDDKYVEMGEAAQEAAVSNKIAQVSAAAIPDEDVPESKQTTHCIETDCGLELPELRRKRGRERCTECETSLERRKKRGF